MKEWIYLIFSVIVISNTYAQDLLRGPYQQCATTHSIKIMWRTSQPTTGWVKVGNTPDNLDKTFSEAASVIDHNVLITDLSAHTKYYYSVGYGDITLASGIDHYILTNEEHGDTSGFSFWVIGDAGRANLPQALARNAFVEHTKDHPVDFMIMLGDNAYQDGTDEEYQETVFSREYAYDSIFRYLHYYPTPGNHDYNILRAGSIGDYLDPTIDKGPYFDIHEMPKNGEAGGVPSNTEIYYSYDYGNAHFICLNSETFTWTSAAASPMKTWLKKDLEANTLPWTIVYFHQPPYTAGFFDTEAPYEIMMGNMRTYILPILENAGVDLVLCGHSHVYERSYLINGFYKKSWAFDPAIYGVNMTSGNPDLGETYVKNPGDKGTVYSIIGNSGSSVPEGDFPEKMHPVHYFRDAGRDVTGSAVVSINGSLLEVEYINRFGDVLDKYAIYKPLKSVPTNTKDNYANIYELSAFPNPSNDFLNVRYNNPTHLNGKIIVTDVSGKQLLVQDANGSDHVTQSVKGWKHLPSGSYVISLKIDNKVSSIQVVKSE